MMLHQNIGCSPCLRKGTSSMHVPRWRISVILVTRCFFFLIIFWAFKSLLSSPIGSLVTYSSIKPQDTWIGLVPVNGSKLSSSRNILARKKGHPRKLNRAAICFNFTRTFTSQPTRCTRKMQIFGERWRCMPDLFTLLLYFQIYKSPMIDFSCIVGFENPHYYVLTFSFVFFPLGMAVYAPGWLFIQKWLSIHMQKTFIAITHSTMIFIKLINVSACFWFHIH